MDKLIIRWVPKYYMKLGASYWASTMKTYEDDVEIAMVTAAEIRRLREQLRVAREAMQDFVDKCDRGEARSVISYAKFSAAFAQLAEPTEVDHG